MTKILILSGKKESGKTSAARFLYGYTLKKIGLISRYNITNEGKLLVNSRSADDVEAMGEFNIENRDPLFKAYASENIWPNIKLYNYADRLKDALHHIFGIDYKFLYEDKNAKTHITWKRFAPMMPPRTISKIKKEFKYDLEMTGRELCQQFGHLCRLVDENCWVDRCVEQINRERPDLALIGDCRFPNELTRTKNFNFELEVRTVRFKKQVDNDTHESEVGLDDWPDEKFDFVLDNSNLSIFEKNKALLEKLHEWEWL
jgi:hypothetical protein